MNLKNWKNLPYWLRGGLFGSSIFAILYAILLLIFRDPDILIFILGPFGIIIWLVQWIPFLIGGWILAIFITFIFFIIAGFLLGILIGQIYEKIKSKKQQ